MNDRYQQAIISCRTDIVAAATTKLGRDLSSVERDGIERIDSLMMLESVYLGFSSDNYSAEEVESELLHFASLSA